MSLHLSTRDFYEHLLAQQSMREKVPANAVITRWAEQVIGVLFPQLSTDVLPDIDAVTSALEERKKELVHMLNDTTACYDCNNADISNRFFQQLPEICRLLNTDIDAILKGDPAARNRFEIIRCYPGFYAISFYRLAHALYALEVPLLPRILTEQAHSRTSIDIHPGAQVGEYFCIDHGSGVVIGETSEIGRNVKIYQGVTLGALSVRDGMAGTKRHPTVEDNVVIYSGATILGGATIIGHDSVIGGNAWLTHSVVPGSLVSHSPEITVVEGKFLKTQHEKFT